MLSVSEGSTASIISDTTVLPAAGSSSLSTVPDASLLPEDPDSTLPQGFTELNESVTEMADVSVLVMRVIVFLVGVVGILDNGMALLVIFRVSAVKKRLGNIYIIHQCIVDLLASVSLMITYLVFLVVKEIQGYSGFLVCKIFFSETFIWTFFAISTCNLVCLNVDRYLQIVYPKTHPFWGQKKIKWVCIAGSWASAMGGHMVVQIETTGVFGTNCYQNAIWPNGIISKVWGYAVFVMSWLAPLALFIAMYSHIYVIVRRSRIAVDHGSSLGDNSKASSGLETGQGQARKISKAEKEVVKTLVLVCTAYFVCTTPSQIYYLMYNVGYQLDFFNNVYYFTLILIMSNCATNPFVYLAKLKDFRNGIRVVCTCVQ